MNISAVLVYKWLRKNVSEAPFEGKIQQPKLKRRALTTMLIRSTTKFQENPDLVAIYLPILLLVLFADEPETNFKSSIVQYKPREDKHTESKLMLASRAMSRSSLMKKPYIQRR